MTLIAALLIITSAFFHAGWNLVSKRQNPSLAFFFIAAASGSAVMSPMLFSQRQILHEFPAMLWLLVALTGMAQAIYLIGLAGAYKRGDISLAYPLARAIPVLLIAGISLILRNGGDIGRLGLLGMGLIVVGCIILPLLSFQSFKLKEYFSPVYLMALVAAIGTTGYTLLDDQALRLMRETAAVQLENRSLTLLYISFQTTSTAVMVGLITLLYPPERAQLKKIFADRPMLRTGLITGVVIMGTYGLALAAMAFVTNVSYVAAFRQLSIPIGAVLGMTIQKEPRYLPKLIGIGIISIGLILVGFG
ncbi:MAG: multidrug DMT transporter permease [Anaerolineae bacterium]